MRPKNKTARRRGKPGGQVREAVVGKRNSTFRSVGPLSAAVKRCWAVVGFSAGALVADMSGRCGGSAGTGHGLTGRVMDGLSGFDCGAEICARRSCTLNARISSIPQGPGRARRRLEAVARATDAAVAAVESGAPSAIY